MDTFVDRKKDVKFSPRFKSKNNNIKKSKLTVMLLTTADLLMKISHARSFSELLYSLCFHSVGDGLKRRVKKKRVLESFFFCFTIRFLFFTAEIIPNSKTEEKQKRSERLIAFCGEFCLENVHVPTTQTVENFFLPIPYESLD